MDNTGSFLKGLLFGAAVGAVAGVLLAPKAGKETREDLMKLYEKVKERAMDEFGEAREMVMEQVAKVKLAGKKIDEQKYIEIVNGVVAELKNDSIVTTEAAKALVSQLRRDWIKVQKVFADKGEVKANLSK